MKLKSTTILDDDQVKAMAALMRQAMPAVAEKAQSYGVDPETIVRRGAQ